MKSLAASIVIIVAVISLTVGGSLLTCSKLNDIKGKAEKISVTNEDFDSIIFELRSVEEEVKRSKHIFSLLLDDDTSEAFCSYIEDIKSAAEAESAEGVLTAKNRLIAHIEQTRRLSTLNIDSVF